MPTVNIPPWLRKLKQSWWFQLIVQPFVVAAMPVLYLSSNGFADITSNSIKAAVIAGGSSLYSAYQKGFNDPSYNPSGTDNQQIAEVVKADAANSPVAVVPVSSPQVRERIRDVVDSGAPVAVVTQPTLALSDAMQKANADSSVPTTASIANKPS